MMLENRAANGRRQGGDGVAALRLLGGLPLVARRSLVAGTGLGCVLGSAQSRILARAGRVGIRSGGLG